VISQTDDQGSAPLSIERIEAVGNQLARDVFRKNSSVRTSNPAFMPNLSTFWSG